MFSQKGMVLTRNTHVTLVFHDRSLTRSASKCGILGAREGIWVNAYILTREGLRMPLVCELAWGIWDKRTENPYALMSLHSDPIPRNSSLYTSELHRLCSRGHGERPIRMLKKTNRKVVCPSKCEWEMLEKVRPFMGTLNIMELNIILFNKSDKWFSWIKFYLLNRTKRFY